MTATKSGTLTLTSARKRIKELEEQNEKLAKELASANSAKDMWYKSYLEYKETVEGIHDVLTDLGIKEWKTEDGGRYDSNRLSLAVRLFSWAMKLAQKSKE